MLKEVEKKMREVTLNAPSYKELKQLYMARDLYIPNQANQYPFEQINEIYKGLAKVFTQLRTIPEGKPFLEEIDVYI